MCVLQQYVYSSYLRTCRAEHILLVMKKLLLFHSASRSGACPSQQPQWCARAQFQHNVRGVHRGCSSPRAPTPTATLCRVCVAVGICDIKTTT